VGFSGGNALLGLLAAAFWGVGDFSGGMGVKTAGGSVGAALRVVLLSHLTSFSVLLLMAWTLGYAFPHGRLLAWGLAAGAAGGLSLCAFYVALSRGAMGASAAVSGVLAAAIPALVAIEADGAPGWRKGVGFGIALAAIWLIAAGNAAHEQASTMALAISAGAGFGIYFVALKYAGAGGVLWPMGTVRISRRAIAWILSTALFDTSGNLIFIAATRAGRLDVAAVLASLYPASTILLAAWTMKERPTRRQAWGMAVAGVAVVLIAG
jgi:drug/metabolite transporter (DMT)-like permease